MVISTFQVLNMMQSSTLFSDVSIFDLSVIADSCILLIYLSKKEQKKSISAYNYTFQLDRLPRFLMKDSSLCFILIILLFQNTENGPRNEKLAVFIYS